MLLALFNKYVINIIDEMIAIKKKNYNIQLFFKKLKKNHFNSMTNLTIRFKLLLNISFISK